MRTVVVFVAFSTVVAGGGHAQTRQADMGSPVRVSYVAECDRGEVCPIERRTGILLRHDAAGVVLRDEGSDRVYHFVSLSPIDPELVRGRKRYTGLGFRVGALLGFVGGAALGASFGHFACTWGGPLGGEGPCEDDAAGAAVLGGLIGAPLGLAAGGLVGALLGTVPSRGVWRRGDRPLPVRGDTVGVLTSIARQDGFHSRWVRSMALGAGLGGLAAFVAGTLRCDDRFRYGDAVGAPRLERVGPSRATCRVRSALLGSVAGGLVGAIVGGPTRPRWVALNEPRLTVTLRPGLGRVSAAATLAF